MAAPNASIPTTADPRRVTEPTLLAGYSQEVVSVVVVVTVCAILTIFSLLVWFLRCRRYQRRREEEKSDRQRELDQFHNDKRQQGTPFSRKKVGDKKPPGSSRMADAEAGKKADPKDPKATKKTSGTEVKKSQNLTGTPRARPATNGIENNEARLGETMGQYEQRIQDEAGPPSNRHLERICEEKRIDSVSNMTFSTSSLQRNDSKVNMYQQDELDLNPALNSNINLEAI